MKSSVLALIMICLGIGFACDQSMLAASDENKINLSPTEQFEQAKQTLQSATNVDVRIESIDDLIQLARTPRKNEEALNSINDFLGKIDEDNEAFGYAQLARARFIGRLGNIDEALALMKQGIAKKWKGHPFWKINALLEETRNFARLAIDEYERTVTDDYSDEIREFHGLGNDLIIFFLRLHRFKLSNPQRMAIEDIDPKLCLATRRPDARDIATSLCMAIDGNTNEALSKINEVENHFSNIVITPAVYHDKLDIPFYKMIIYYQEGKHLEEIESFLIEYIKSYNLFFGIQNPYGYQHALNKILEFIYEMENDHDSLVKVQYVTKGIMNSEIIRNDSIRKEMDEDKIASVYEMHAHSLLSDGKTNEAKEIYKRLYDESFPRNMASVQAALSYASLLFRFEGKTDEAESILLRIVNESTYPEAVMGTFLVLKEIWEKKGANQEQIAQQLINVIDSTPPGNFKNYLNEEYTKFMMRYF